MNDYLNLFDYITFYKQKAIKKLQNGNYFCLSEYQSMKRRVLKFWNDHDFAFYDNEIDIM